MLFPAVALEATCREEMALIKSADVFSSGKLQVCLVLILGTKFWVSSSLNRLLSAWLFPGQCLCTLSEGEIIRKEVSYKDERST